MPKNYKDGYQLDDLREAVAALVAQVDGLAVSIDWTGDYETTFSHGAVPTVEYTVDVRGRADDDFHLAAVPVVALHLTHGIEEALGKIEDQKIRVLVDNVCNCRVT